MINKSKNTYSVQRDTQQSHKDTKFSLEHNWYVTKLIIIFYLGVINLYLIVIIPIQFIYFVIIIIIYFIIVYQIKYIFYKFMIKLCNARAFN